MYLLPTSGHLLIIVQRRWLAKIFSSNTGCQINHQTGRLIINLLSTHACSICSMFSFCLPKSGYQPVQLLCLCKHIVVPLLFWLAVSGIALSAEPNITGPTLQYSTSYTAAADNQLLLTTNQPPIEAGKLQGSTQGIAVELFTLINTHQ